MSLLRYLLISLFGMLCAGCAQTDSLRPFFTPPEEFRDDFGTYAPLRIGRTAADWQKRRGEILAEWHKTLGPWPPLIERPKIRYVGKEQVENFARHEVEIEVAPGRTTIAYLLIPEGQGPFPAVLDVYYQPRDGAGVNRVKRGQNDFGYQLARRGFVSLCVGQELGVDNSPVYYPSVENAQLQPLSYLAYVAANCHTLLSQLPGVDAQRIGVVGHSYGGKWALFAGAFCDKFAAVCVSDPAIVFDETRPNANYWDPWYLGYEPGPQQRKGRAGGDPRIGAYKELVAAGHDLHELHALIAPRPFLVAGGSEDPPERWRALNHAVAVNRLLGYEDRVGMLHRPTHKITPEANEQICRFFESHLKTNHE